MNQEQARLERELNTVKRAADEASRLDNRELWIEHFAKMADWHARLGEEYGYKARRLERGLEP